MSVSIWDRCLTQLENEYSEQQLNMWIRPLQADEVTGNLLLMAPNQFVRQWVVDNCIGRIEEIVVAVSPAENPKIVLEVGTGETLIAGASANGSAGFQVAANNSQAAPINSTDQANAGGNNVYRKNLDPAYTYDTFVVGKSNQFGNAASQVICEKPGTGYNPFFLCGPSGVGKTHLMQAIGHGILDRHPNARVIYLNSEEYVADMVAAIQRNTMDEFKRRYRNADALLIDDIQFFAGKGRTQEEFFHTYNALYRANSQIILTCDRYPKEVEGLETRLVSRFGGGMTVAVEPPDLETRVAILNKKAELEKATLPSEVSFFVARAIRSNVRELEGALKRVIAAANFHASPITVELARDALSDLVAVQAKQVSIENIQKVVAEYWNIRLSDLSAKTRSRSIARPRQMAMALSKELTNKSLPEIGRAFGGRDHTTVIHACKKIAELREADQSLDEDYSNLVRILTS